MKIWIYKLITVISILGLFFCACENRQMSPDKKLIGEAEENIETQNYEIAQQKLLSAIHVNPNNIKAQVLLGDVYYFQSNLIMYRMQVLNLILKYGKRLYWATGKELDLATPTEESLKKGMEHYQNALLLLTSGYRDDEVEESYIHYELGWGYLAEDDIAEARKSFQNSKIGGVDRWDAKSALTYVAFLERRLARQEGLKNK